MTDITDHARGALRAQPFSMLLGTELMHIGDNEVSLCLPVREELRQQHGFVHGGVISYLADNALTFAGALVLGTRVITAEYKINYLRPAVNG
ncbi:PaaI family thioesterase, partial [Serratia marcescens]|uniref:PaaI family thioesterase n=1 Tax=Serratia marcescens TaxID=615 RepID=UPI0011153F88